jgi:hypothetical protein
MKKYVTFILMIAFGVALLSGCGLHASDDLRVDYYHNQDAKFWKKDEVMTSKDGELHILSYANGKQVDTPIDGVKTNWIDGIPDENLIVYGNGDKEFGICKLNDDNTVKSNKIIMSGGELKIDPSIIKVKDTYYLSLTTIEGTVNNADPNHENGIYTITFYQSKNLNDWEKIGQIAQEQHNLEDTELHYENGVFYLMYEKETVDHGDSSINVIRSNDMGKTWGDNVELIPTQHDNEPTSLVKTENGWELFYSSDKAHPGESYQGADCYEATFDNDFNRINDYQKINDGTSKGVLLYDIEISKDKYTLLYTEDYMTDSNLVVKTVNK